MNRRKMLAVVGSLGVTTIAGCSSTNTESEPDGNESDTTGNTNTPDTNDDTETAAEEPTLAPVTWSQRGGGPKRTHTADVTALTADNPSTTVLGKEFRQAPLLAANRIIWKGGVYDRSSSKVRDLPARTNLDLDFTPQLAYSDGTLIVPRQGELVGVDPVAGEELWRYKTRAPPVRTVAQDGTAYAILFDDGSVVAVDIASGDRRWRREIEDIKRSPLAAGTYLYVSQDTLDGDQLFALDFETGETVAEMAGSGRVRIGPSNDLYNGRRRLSPEGEVQWEAELDQMLAVDSQYVYARETFDNPNTLKAVNPDNGSISWEFELPSRYASPTAEYNSVAAGSDHVYVAIRQSNRVFAISKADGTRAGIYSMPEPRAPIVGDGMLAVVSGFSGQYSDTVTRTGVRVLSDE